VSLFSAGNIHGRIAILPTEVLGQQTRGFCGLSSDGHGSRVVALVCISCYTASWHVDAISARPTGPPSLDRFEDGSLCAYIFRSGRGDTSVPRRLFFSRRLSRPGVTQARLRRSRPASTAAA